MCIIFANSPLRWINLALIVVLSYTFVLLQLIYSNDDIKHLDINFNFIN